MNSKSKIKKLNSVLSTTCLALIVILPVVDLLFWFNFEDAVQYLDTQLGNRLQFETLQTWQIVIAALFSLVTTLIFVFGLWHLRRLFNSFKHAAFFTTENTHSMYTVAKLLVLSTILKCLNTPLFSVLLTWNNGPGQKALIVSLGSNELWLFIISATFFTIAWTFREGQKLGDENAKFI